MGSSTWLGDLINTGSELSLDHGLMDGNHASSNGNVVFNNNYWQSSDGIYHYQMNDGLDPQHNGSNVLRDAPLNPVYWVIRPSQDQQGGVLDSECGTACQ